jgi:very-short-patch-repair endonuclease
MRFPPPLGRGDGSIDRAGAVSYKYPMARRNRRLLRFAREMRQDPTLGESILWQHLRGRQLGVRFRRQEPIGPFIADFACIQHSLVVEVDGDTHVDRARDARRDTWFLTRGWFVLRFWDDDVIADRAAVLDVIHAAIGDPLLIQDPLNREA